MRRIVSLTPRISPAAFVLVAQMIAVACGLWAAGKLSPVAVPDTVSYVEFPFSSWSAALGHLRTPGYPLFLSLIAQITPDYSAAPLIHFIAYGIAVGLVHRGLRHVCPSSWQRMAISSSLLYSNILLGYVEILATDTLAAAGGIAVTGLLVERQTAPSATTANSRWLNLLAIGLILFATCLVRPAYLFLIIFVPLTGTFLSWLTERNSLNLPDRGGSGFRKLLDLWKSGVGRNTCRAAVELLAVSVTPLLAYCTLRWCVVGKFGLVAFGGFNLIGISGQWLDASLLSNLPEASRPLAQRALEYRQRITSSTPVSGDLTNYSEMEARYDTTIWQVFHPAARDLFGDDTRRTNTELRQLASAIVRARPKLYAIWLVKSTRQAARVVVSDFVRNPAYLLLTAACVLLQLGATLFGRRTPSADQEPRTKNQAAVANSAEQGGILFLVAVLYAGLQLLLVILVCPPLGRMTDAAAVLLPMVLANFLASSKR